MIIKYVIGSSFVVVVVVVVIISASCVSPSAEQTAHKHARTHI